MNVSEGKKVYITGSSGMLGRTFVKALNRESKHDVTCLSRDSSGSYVTSLRHLEDSVQDRKITRTLIHCGWNTRARSQAEQTACTEATRQLADFCSEASIQFVFVSSQSASTNAKSIYGQCKFSAESAAIDAGGIVIRPGLILFDPPSRLQRYLEIVARLPVRVSVNPDPSLLVISANELADSIEMICSLRNPLPGIYEVPNTETTLNAYLARRSPTRRIQIVVQAQTVHRSVQLLKHMGRFGSSMSDSIMGLIS